MFWPFYVFINMCNFANTKHFQIRMIVIVFIVTVAAVSDSQSIKIGLESPWKAGWQINEDDFVNHTNEAGVYFQTVCNETNNNNTVCQCKETPQNYNTYTSKSVYAQHNLYVERSCPIERPLTEINTYIYNRNQFLLKNNNRGNTVKDICLIYKAFQNNTSDKQDAEMFCDLYNYFENNTNYIFVVKEYKVWNFSSDSEVIPLKKDFAETDWFLNKR